MLTFYKLYLRYPQRSPTIMANGQFEMFLIAMCTCVYDNIWDCSEIKMIPPAATTTFTTNYCYNNTTNNNRINNFYRLISL